jgi:hypothetical protein
MQANPRPSPNDIACGGGKRKFTLNAVMRKMTFAQASQRVGVD